MKICNTYNLRTLLVFVTVSKSTELSLIVLKVLIKNKKKKKIIFKNFFLFFFKLLLLLLLIIIINY